jgi:hypothetical protein
MKFPITREALQAFDLTTYIEELKEEALQRSITHTVDQICKEFKQSMSRLSDNSCMTTKKFVWTKLQNCQTPYYNISGINRMFNIIDIDAYVSQLIEKLKEVFIGCDIITDPLKTYIIIDWS